MNLSKKNVLLTIEYERPNLGDLPFLPNVKGNLTGSCTKLTETSFDLIFKDMVKAQDDILYSPSQDVNTIEDGYAIFDASLVFEDHNDRWTATVFVKNIATNSTLLQSSPTILLFAEWLQHRYGRDAARALVLKCVTGGSKQ